MKFYLDVLRPLSIAQGKQYQSSFISRLKKELNNKNKKIVDKNGKKLEQFDKYAPPSGGNVFAVIMNSPYVLQFGRLFRGVNKIVDEALY
jgi:hypothetical protein